MARRPLHKPRLRHVAGPSGFRTGATRDDRPRGTPLMTTSHPVPDLVLRNGRFTTLDRAKPIASAVSIREGKFVAVGDDAEVVPLAGATTRVIDLKGRLVLP